MALFLTVLLPFLFLLVAKQLLALVNLRASLTFYRRGLDTLESTAGNEAARRPRLIVVIPVLYEQYVIAATLAYFQMLDYPALDLVVVTTERERAEAAEIGQPTTIDVVQKLQATGHSFTWVHYPEPTGTKAAQLNYVTSNFARLFPGYDPAATFFAFYDADSRPHPQTMAALAALVARYPTRRVFQQSALFYANYSALPSLFLQAQAVRQTRFTLAYEVPRLINQLHYYAQRPTWRSLLGVMTYAHCVGHGLFVRADLAQEVPFPPFVQEDMAYGFTLNCRNEPITPLPFLTSSDMPIDLGALFGQKARWFLGPARVWRYRSYVRQTAPTCSRRSLFLALFGTYDALNWVLTSPLFGLSLALVGYGIAWRGKVNPPWLWWATIGLALLWPILYLASVTFLMHHQAELLTLAGVTPSSHPLSWGAQARLLAVFPLVLLFHSLPTYASIFAVARRKVQQIGHRKAERPPPAHGPRPVIVAFEGPCLAGKTTTLRTIQERLTAAGWDVLVINEYSAKTVANTGVFPPVYPASAAAARTSARFFLDLERVRGNTIALWRDQPTTATPRVVLVDRSLAFCLALRHKIGDHVGYNLILRSIRAGDMICPDLTIFLRLPGDAAVYTERRVQRGYAVDEQQEPLDRQAYHSLREDLEAFIRRFDDRVRSLHLHFFTAAQVDEIEQTIRALVTTQLARDKR